MRQHGYVRFTEDIDLVTTREGLNRLHERLVGRGLAPRGPGLRKKLRDKGFARTVNRDDVYRGAAELGVDLDAHIAFVIAALNGVATEIGLHRAAPTPA